MEEGREAPGQAPWYTVVGVIDDGAQLNQAVKEIRDLGVDRDDLTVILKREDLGEPEPFPEGTRYIVIPADKRGLEVPIGFAIAFIVFGVLFAITTPSIGVPTLMVFLSLAGILFVGSLTRVGVSPILTEMEAPPRGGRHLERRVRDGEGPRLRLDARAAAAAADPGGPAARRRDVLHRGPAA